MQVHEAACLRRLFCFRAPLPLFLSDVLIRQQPLCIPHRGISDNPLACFNDCWGLLRVCSPYLHPNCLPTCSRRYRSSVTCSTSHRHDRFEGCHYDITTWWQLKLYWWPYIHYICATDKVVVVIGPWANLWGSSMLSTEQQHNTTPSWQNSNGLLWHSYGQFDLNYACRQKQPTNIRSKRRRRSTKERRRLHTSSTHRTDNCSGSIWWVDAA